MRITAPAPPLLLYIDKKFSLVNTSKQHERISELTFDYGQIIDSLLDFVSLLYFI